MRCEGCGDSVQTTAPQRHYEHAFQRPIPTAFQRPSNAFQRPSHTPPLYPPSVGRDLGRLEDRPPSQPGFAAESTSTLPRDNSRLLFFALLRSPFTASRRCLTWKSATPPRTSTSTPERRPRPIFRSQWLLDPEDRHDVSADWGPSTYGRPTSYEFLLSQHGHETARRKSNRRRDQEMPFGPRSYRFRLPTWCTRVQIGDIRGMWSWRSLQPRRPITPGRA
jgi:hypothetical protein